MDDGNYCNSPAVQAVSNIDPEDVADHSRYSFAQTDDDSDDLVSKILKNGMDMPQDGPNQGNKASTDTENENVNATVSHEVCGNESYETEKKSGALQDKSNEAGLGVISFPSKKTESNYAGDGRLNQNAIKQTHAKNLLQTGKGNDNVVSIQKSIVEFCKRGQAVKEIIYPLVLEKKQTGEITVRLISEDFDESLAKLLEKSTVMDTLTARFSSHPTIPYNPPSYEDVVTDKVKEEKQIRELLSYELGKQIDDKFNEATQFLKELREKEGREAQMQKERHARVTTDLEAVKTGLAQLQDRTTQIQTERHEQVMTDLEAVKIGLGQFQDQMTESLEQITTDLIKLRRADDLKTERTPVEFDLKTHCFSDDDNILVKTNERPIFSGCKRCGCRSTCRCRCHLRGSPNANRAGFGRRSYDSDDGLGDRKSLDRQMHRRSKVEKTKNVGACGGQPGGSSDDPSDDSDDSKKRGYERQRKIRQSRKKDKWVIDSTAWNACIDQKAAEMIDELISEKKLPSNDQLHEAHILFATDHVKKICDAIYQYIYIHHKSKHIKYVYAGHEFDTTTGQIDKAKITFVVILEKYVDFEDEFYFEIIPLDAYKEPSDKFRRLEKETSKLTQCLRKHSKPLMEKHSNVCRISSGHKSVDEGCIALYVYSKKYIPLGEDLLPKTLEIDNDQLVVDVREGFVEAYTNDKGPNDRLDHLQMGCSISGTLFKDSKKQCGTLGGFFEDGHIDCCLSSCHAFLSAKQMERLRMEGTGIFLDEIDRVRRREAYQPYDSHLQPFGQCRVAVYIEGGNEATGVDVMSIQINERNPKCGGFPKSAEGNNTEKVFSEGAVYNRKEIHDLLEIDNNRRFYKYGCKTGWTTGMFHLDGAAFRMPHPVQDGETQFNICLHNQFEIQSDSENDFAAKGDSGALVFLEDNEKLVAIGMVEAGMAEDVCFVTPLDAIFEALRLNPKDGLKNFNSGVNRSVSIDSGVHISDSHFTVSVREEITTLKSDISHVKSDVVSLKGEMSDVKGEVSEMKVDMNQVKTDVGTIKSHVNDIKSFIMDFVGNKKNTNQQ